MESWWEDRQTQAEGGQVQARERGPEKRLHEGREFQSLESTRDASVLPSHAFVGYRHRRGSIL